MKYKAKERNHCLNRHKFILTTSYDLFILQNS